MATVKETDWFDGARDWKSLEPFVMIIANAMFDPSMVGRCIKCRAEQPHDVKWSAFGFELESKADGSNSGDLAFNCCPKCEPEMDALLDRLGAHPPIED